MTEKNAIRPGRFWTRLLAGWLNLATGVVLAVASLGLPFLAFAYSAAWFAVDIDREGAARATFFVAFQPGDPKLAEPVRVVRFRENLVATLGDEYPRVDFQLPPGRLQYWDPLTELSATIHVGEVAEGAQLIQVYAAGDSLWASLSRYRAGPDGIEPLSHGQSMPWFLIGLVVLPFLFLRVYRQMRRRTRRLLGLEPLGR